MTAAIAAGRRYLPRGYADLLRQMLIWFGFLAAYQVARGIADRDPTRAFENGWRVLGVEQGITNDVIELTLQHVAESSAFLNRLASLTYWTSEFAVVGLALLWVYLRRHHSFRRFRNTILLANVVGLVGYVLLPTAPPRASRSAPPPRCSSSSRTGTRSSSTGSARSSSSPARCSTSSTARSRGRAGKGRRSAPSSTRPP